MKAFIKNINLRPAPKPTKAYRNDWIYGESAGAMHLVNKPPIATLEEDRARRERAAKARGRAEGRAEKRHDMIARLARDGLSDAEIAEQTGYKPDSVRRLIGKMRNEGVDIPERTRGRKKKCRD